MPTPAPASAGENKEELRQPNEQQSETDGRRGKQRKSVDRVATVARDERCPVFANPRLPAASVATLLRYMY
eukprot:scaffold74723_cov69-Phaeocystis_antarctica.AAC.2